MEVITGTLTDEGVTVTHRVTWANGQRELVSPGVEADVYVVGGLAYVDERMAKVARVAIEREVPDAVSALIALGWTRTKAEKAAPAAYAGMKSNALAWEIAREAIRRDNDNGK